MRGEKTLDVRWEHAQTGAPQVDANRQKPVQICRLPESRIDPPLPLAKEGLANGESSGGLYATRVLGEFQGFFTIGFAPRFEVLTRFVPMEAPGRLGMTR